MSDPEAVIREEAFAWLHRFISVADEYGVTSENSRYAEAIFAERDALAAEVRQLREQHDADQAKIISLATDFLNEQSQVRQLREALEQIAKPQELTRNASGMIEMPYEIARAALAAEAAR